MPFWKEGVGETTMTRKKDEYDQTVDGYGDIIEKGITDHAEHVQDKLDKSPLGKKFEIVLPEPNQLMLDYDAPEVPKRFYEVIDMLTQAYCQRGYRGLTYKITESRSGNRHVLITLPCSITDLERLAWQAVFGSDYTRDALGLMSVSRGIKNPVLFLERKGGAKVMEEGKRDIPQPTGRKFRD